MDGIEVGGSKPQVSQVKYSKDFEIPADFPEILRDLTREILRANPTDINKFAMDYFAAKVAEKESKK